MRESERQQTSDAHKWRALADQEMLDRFVRQAQPRSTDVALDAGTGKGNTAIALAPHVQKVIAIDPDPEMIKTARAAAEKKSITNIHFKVGAVEQQLDEPEDSFDIVTCRAALHHFPDKGAFLAEARRVLCPSGKLCIMDPVVSSELRTIWTVLSRLGERDHNAYCTYEELMGLLALNGLEVRSMYPFLFERKLDDWIDGKVREVNEEGEEIHSEYVTYVRRRFREIVLEFMEPHLRDELHFHRRTGGSWFYYNCVEILAIKV